MRWYHRMLKIGIPLFILGLLPFLYIYNIYSAPGLGYYFMYHPVHKKFHFNPDETLIWDSNQSIIKQELLPLPVEHIQVQGGYSLEPIADGEDIRRPTGNPYASSVTEIPMRAAPIGDNDHLSHERFIRFQVSLIHQRPGYMDFVFENPVPMPVWTRMIDFWMHGLSDKISITFYTSYNQQQRQKFTFFGEDPRAWEKESMCLAGSNMSFQRAPYYIHRIRIQSHGNEVPRSFDIFITFPKVHNFIKPDSLQPLDSLYMYEDFDHTLPYWTMLSYQPHQLPPVEQWHTWMDGEEYRIEATYENRTVYQIDPVPLPIERAVKSNNEQDGYWQIQFDRTTLSNRPFLVAFDTPYMIYKNFYVSIQVLGYGDGSELIAVMEEGHGRYFELSMGYLDFEGWQKILTPLPKEEIFFFSDPLTDKDYIRLWGFKIAPGNVVNNELQLGLDEIGSSYDYHQILP